MIEPEPCKVATGDAGAEPLKAGGGDHLLPPRMRLFLYFTAGAIFALWISLEILGAAGFVAFVIAMLSWQGMFRLRPSINAAFVAALVGYALTIAVWTVAFGPPQPGQHTPTATALPAR